MKKIFFLLLSALTSAVSFSQKKLAPVSQSALTGINLPNGSKQDSRMLVVSAAKMLLEMESKKSNSSLSEIEVLTLPPVSSCGFNKDSLVKNLTSLGWIITPVQGDEKYVWLQKDRAVIAYFDMTKKETGLYFAVAASNPNQNSQMGPVNNQPLMDNNQVQQPANTEIQNTPVEITQPSGEPITNTGFAFTTTNFDNGWTATVQEDWVEVTKGNIKALVHYPNKNVDAYNTVLMDALKNAWDVLVAPKYSTAANFEFKPLQSWQSIEFAEADAVERNSGKTVHVVLFKKHYSGGEGKYLEFITPAKNFFEQEFGAYVNEASDSYWDKIAGIAGYNKFAVGAADLRGKWTNKFTGIQQYVNAYTGADAGMDTHASAEKFEFRSDNMYNWEISVASGFVGSIKFNGAKSAGQWSLLNNWQIHFSEIEKKEKTYNAYFSCIKGARILWLQDTGYGGYTAYGKAE